MSIEGILKVGGNNSVDVFEGNKAQKPSFDEDGLFTLKFEPEAFGGKLTDSNVETSIFDSWDS